MRREGRDKGERRGGERKALLGFEKNSGYGPARCVTLLHNDAIGNER